MFALVLLLLDCISFDEMTIKHFPIVLCLHYVFTYCTYIPINITALCSASRAFVHGSNGF